MRIPFSTRKGGSLRNALAVYSKERASIIGGKCPYAEYFINGSQEGHNTRPFVARRMDAIMLYMGIRLWFYDSAFWELAIGPDSYAEEQFVLDMEKKNCCAQTSSDRKAQTKHESFGDDSAYWIFCDSLRKGASGLKCAFNGVSFLGGRDSEGSFSATRFLDCKSPYRPHRGRTINRDVAYFITDAVGILGFLVAPVRSSGHLVSKKLPGERTPTMLNGYTLFGVDSI